MQPYLFPYIGYFQLINSADKFVIYNDVAFIKQGWINRNNILSGNKAGLFSVPLKDASSYKLIKDTLIDENLYLKWKEKFHRTVEVNYRKAPFYPDVFKLINDVFETKTENITEMARKSIELTCSYLEINTILGDSESYNNSSLKSQERVLDICKIENAGVYINAAGGKDLYSKDVFKSQNIDLFFLNQLKFEYKQYNFDFVTWLSIIDVMMFNSKEEVKIILEKYELI